MAADAYEGPVCYVGHDHDAADGRPLEAGWHYAVIDDGHGGEMPGEKLYLDADTGAYRHAVDGDKSWHERQHQRLIIVAPGGSIGEPRTPEEIEACHRHLDVLEQRIAADSFAPHEADHILTTAEEVRVVRGWLQRKDNA